MPPSPSWQTGHRSPWVLNATCLTFRASSTATSQTQVWASCSAKTRPRVADDALLLEPAPLNAEQRNAVRNALTEPLTVITGPPGTGKSQVVSAILVNAAWRGQRVLFSSKNNKAVDVVLDRVNALTPRPTVLRLGTRALQEQLAQHLSAILSSRPTADDRRAYERTLAQLERRGEAFNAKLRAYDDLVVLRNRVDGLERAAEEARTILKGVHFSNAAAVLESELPHRRRGLWQQRFAGRSARGHR